MGNLDSLEGLEGGELAAALSKEVRADMIQRGYNPMQASDVQRYAKNQKPEFGLAEAAGVKEYKNLGGGREVDSRDSSLLQQFESETGNSLVSRGVSSGDPREEARSVMNNYGRGTGNLDAKLLGLSERLNSGKEQRVLGPGPIQNKRLIQTPKQTLPIINEAAKAKKVGYVIGIKYINAFIVNIKAPSTANRALVMEELNKMVLLESKIVPACLREYRQGIAQAEMELYLKIRQK